MSALNRNNQSYQSVDAEEDEDGDRGGADEDNRLEMAAANEGPSIARHYSASAAAAAVGDPHLGLVGAFSELSLRQHSSLNVIQNRLKKKRISKKEAQQQLKQAYKTLAHTLDRGALEHEYYTSCTTGLHAGKVTALLNDADVGYNELTPPKHDPEWLRFLKCTFGNLLSVLLSGGAILSLIAYGIDPHSPKDPSSLYLGIVLVLVVLITGVFIFYQEGKSSNLMSALSAMKPAHIMVMREGQRQEIEPRELVPGDVCLLQMGMRIPADLRVIECSDDLEVDNSSLTGESEPQKRSAKPEPSDIIPAESKCLCFFGTLVVNGNGSGLVIQTGDHTFMGRTAALASSTHSTKTPIQREIHDFVQKIAYLAITVGLAFFIAAMVLDASNWTNNVILLIGIVITNVPEELMAVVTVQLTLTAQILFRRNVQVKQLGSVETLGSISVICSDKTGTLTTNRMTVQHVYYDLRARVCDTLHPLHALDGDFYDNPVVAHRDEDTKEEQPDGQLPSNFVSETALFNKMPQRVFLKLVRCALLCNNAAFIQGGTAMDPTANATEAAMMCFASGHLAAMRMNLTEYRRLHKKLHEIPFNSKNKWQVSVHELPQKMLIKSDVERDPRRLRHDPHVQADKKWPLVQMKGAPERILTLCDKYVHDRETLPLTQDIRDRILNQGVLALGAKGERVLALAELILDDTRYDINCKEPQLEAKYEHEVESEYAQSDCVVVCYQQKRLRIDLSLADMQDANESEADDSETKDRVTSFGDVTIEQLMRCISEKINVPIAAQRVAFSDCGVLDEHARFSEVGIQRGSVLHVFKGPYKFHGATKEEMNAPLRNLVFVGLIAMIDPARPGVPEAIASCSSAGIQVIMVTGDHPITAKAIAESVGIFQKNGEVLVYNAQTIPNEHEFAKQKFDAIVVPGSELQGVLDHEPEDPQGVAAFWNRVLHCSNIVFARTSPQQKLLIVSAVQERGAIVAVTGDGVNDSPALKKADIGVAMGITGTAVAKEAANMILLDDNFTTIVGGIEQGRIIFDNLKKSISYSLGKNVPEIVPFLCNLIFGCPLPLTPLLLLCVDLGTDIMPSISLAMEKKESDIMTRKPRNPKRDRLGTLKLICMAEAVFGVFAALAGMYGYFTVLYSYGFLPTHLIHNIDRDYVFGFYGNQQRLRDAYYLWCFDPSVTAQCYYLPNFYDEYIPRIYHDHPFKYYDQFQFYEWQMNSERYALKAKQYLVDISNDTTWGIPPLTMQQLNGQDVDGNGCCNPQLQNGSTNVQCVSQQTAECAEQYLSWTAFFSAYWDPDNGSGILGKFMADVFRPPVFINRQCDDEDYFSLYMAPQQNQPPPYCDWRNTQLCSGGRCPRTFSDIESPFSFFPIQTRTRAEALAQAQTAYLVAIVVMQLADLLTIRTRVSSIFQQGMANTFMNYALIFEVFLIAFLVYIPWANDIVGTRPLRWVHWTAAFPYAITAIIYHELRKGYIRKDTNRQRWVTRNTMW